ncbi:MAG: CopG family transcriptional regulator [Candidatus Eremiobacterota bacterium]
MKRTTVMLPEDLKIKAEQKAIQEGISLSELIRISLAGYIKRSVEKSKDSFFSDKEIFYGDVPCDLSENHDIYLYGEKS